MQIVVAEDGNQSMGLLTQITPGPELEICGDGFNDKTVKVRMGDRAYFVFREDLGLTAHKPAVESHIQRAVAS